MFLNLPQTFPSLLFPMLVIAGSRKEKEENLEEKEKKSQPILFFFFGFTGETLLCIFSIRTRAGRDPFSTDPNHPPPLPFDQPQIDPSGTLAFPS
jgi:hypothetical protein